MNVSEASLTEPLLTDGEEEFIGNVNDGGSRSSSQQDISEADNSNPADPNERTKADVDLNPSALHFTDLEYEPSDSSDNAQAPIKMIKVSQPQKKEALRTASEPVCVQCEHCNTVCETTVVQVFGMSTCLWICILLVICFPIAWIPLFWKDCHDTKHYCTYCSEELGRSKAKCCQFKRMGGELDQMQEDLEQRVADAKITML